jgi:hypothetical protein
MATVTGLFHDRDEAVRGLDALRSAGFGEDEVTIVASPSSAGIAAEQAASGLAQPADGFVDLGAVMGGQGEHGFAREERFTYEERVAAGDILLRVQVAAPERASLAHAILEDAGADRVGPGFIRD